MSPAAKEPKKPRPAGFITADMRSALGRRYREEEWLTAWEVQESSGSRSRSCDLLALNLWQSRGQALVGHELKATRSDWLRELRDPAKGEGFFIHCDRWYLVSPPGVCKEGELPEGWGHLEMVGEDERARLVERVPAPQRIPPPLPREMLCSFARRLAKPAHTESEREIQRRVDERLASSEAHWKQRMDMALELQSGRIEQLERLEKLSGVTIAGWIDDAQLQAAFALAMELRAGGRSSLKRTISFAADRLRSISDDFAGQSQELQELLSRLDVD